MTPTYDANGNVTSAGSTTYAYNAENRLVTASGATYQELIDDSLDRLFRYYDGAANRWMVYAGDRLIGEYASGGTMLRGFVPGPDGDEPVAW